MDIFNYLHAENLQTIRHFQDLTSDDWKRRLLANLKFKRARENVIEDVVHRIAWTLRKP
jgi:hypothetical protein